MKGEVGSEAAARVWCDAEGARHIDVRGLAAPQPLVQILRLVATLPADAELIVHHEREPLLLYPELARIGWEAQPLPGELGEVRLKLVRLGKAGGST